MSTPALKDTQRSAQILSLRLRDGLDDATIAARAGTNVALVRRTLREFAVVASGLADADATFKTYEADLLDATRRQIIKHANDKKKLKRASLHNLAFAYDKLLTGARLLRGETTENVGLKAAIVLAAHDELPAAEPEPIAATAAPVPIATLARAQHEHLKRRVPKQTPVTMPAPQRNEDADRWTEYQTPLQLPRPEQENDHADSSAHVQSP